MIAKRNTVQRQIILDVLKNFTTHPSADVIYSEIHKKHPTISKSTVYRNLAMLSQEGIITRISATDDAARYDGIPGLHYHCACKVCGEILDVEMDYIKDIDSAVQKNYGFATDRHEIVFRGTCSKCVTSEGTNK